MADLDGLNISFTNTSNNHLIFSNTAHNNSQSTINSAYNNSNTLVNDNTIINNLKRENESLQKKIDYLQKIIKVKDNTIDDLNKKLLSYTSDNKHNRTASTATETSIASSNNDFVVNLHPSPVKSIPENSIIDSLSSPIVPHLPIALTPPSISTPSNTSSPNNNNNQEESIEFNDKYQTIWEIPQRNSNRKSSQQSRQSSIQTGNSLIPNQNLNISDISQNDSESDFNIHLPRVSISSLTSSQYSSKNKTSDYNDNDDDDNNNNTNDYNTSNYNEEEDDNDNDKNLSNTNNINPNNSHELTLDLQNQLDKGDLTLGSSPRRSGSNRRELLSQDLNFSTSDSKVLDDNLHFGNPDDPIYKKSNQDSLYSPNSSPNPDSLPIKTPLNDHFEVPGATPGSEYSISSNSITGTPINLRTESTNSILNPLTTLKNNIPDKLNHSSSSPLSTNVPPTPPPHPPHTPHHHTNSNLNNNSKQDNNVTSANSNDDSEKFLLNSLKQCVIRIESLIDPQGLAVPIETITNHVIAKSKRDNYKISFLVYIDENPNSLTPIYRVKKSYVELLVMDKTVRPLVPSLPKLPDFSHVASLNYKNWAHSKKIIQSYINKLLTLLKSQNPLNQNSPIWKHFSNYFEFKMDANATLDDENAEYSVMNLQEKICYLLYIRKNFTTKTYDFVKLNYSLDTDELVMIFTLSKSQESIPKDEVNISFKGQEITIKRKKKFAANKSWTLFAESEYDAHYLSTRINKWIGYNNGDNTTDDNQNSVSTNDDESTKVSASDTKHKSYSDDTEQKSSIISENTLSPAINNTWKLFKKTAKQIPTSPRPNNHSNNSIGNSVPSTPSKIGSSSSSTPSHNGNQQSNHNNNSFNDVLNFKAMPYESNKLTVDNSFNHNNGNTITNSILKSPMRHMNEKPTEILFQPIDETPKYFKSTLQYSYDLCPKYKLYGYDVSSIVYQCITFLYQQSGEGFEGIFRLNGMMSEVNKIQEIFNTEYDCQLSKLNPVPDVHSIATLLKRYLRNIQDRLITSDIASNLCEIINNNENHLKRSGDDKADIESGSLILSATSMLTPSSSQEFKRIYRQRIPQLNRNVLFVLFKYLTDVLKMGKHNKMTISAMSVLMGPNLTQSDGGGQICTVLLENFNQICL